MIFVIDTLDQTVVARHKRGDAARFVIDKLGAKLEPGEDPVKKALLLSGDRMAMLNLSGAFESISESDNKIAQALATDMKKAVDQLYD